MRHGHRVCIDASVALAAVLQKDPNHESALNVLAELADADVALCAPALFAYECDSVIRLNVYRGSLSATQAEECLELLEQLNVALEFSLADRKRAREIGTIYSQPRAYDAAYAAYAEARGIELLTTDKPFFEAVRGNKRPHNQPALEFIFLL